MRRAKKFAELPVEKHNEFFNSKLRPKFVFRDLNIKKTEDVSDFFSKPFMSFTEKD